MKQNKNLKSGICTRLRLALSFGALTGALVFLLLPEFAPLLSRGSRGQPQQTLLPAAAAAESKNEIAKATYTRREFFGVEALVPLPTAEARENLTRLAAAEPDNPEVLEKLAEAHEKLEEFDAAEKILLRLAERDLAKLETLAAFYQRRARFAAEAEVLRKILFAAEPENRPAALERLLALARAHELKTYLNEDFYAEAAKENPHAFEIFEKLIDKLAEEKNYAEALKFTRQAKAQFPDRRSALLEREISLLVETGQPQEAERVYQAAFDPFWSAAEAQNFYDFLNRQNRLRAYGAEIKNRVKKNPADFDAAVRLALYRNYDYSYGNDEIAPVMLRLEAAKKSWTTEELVTVTRLLLRSGEGETASRFLYTLYAREDFKQNPGLRAAILYQLFEMFSDAENQRLPLTKGDLRFYEDVARADTSPGIATGILSLLFSDTNPQNRLAEQEAAATKFFNRAAAYRIFEEYKKEFPTSPELAQMYLDLVRLYAASGETEVAEKILNEFAARFEDSSAYAAVALKLADAFAAVQNHEKAREINQKVLDYLGKTGAPKFGSGGGLPANAGIRIPAAAEKRPDDDYDNAPESIFTDYLARPNPAVNYGQVLEKQVASFAAENKTAEILVLYSNEIAKYPGEERLYELRAAQLEQTNLVAEQLEAYQTALQKFPTGGWRDKLARWFLRQQRRTEFAEFSAALVGKLNDDELETYLSNFVDGRDPAGSFDKAFYLKIYQSAHERFPHNARFVNKLLDFYRAEKRESDWRRLAAEYFFEFGEVREKFLDHLAAKGELREYLARAVTGENVVYELFRADASARLSDYENAVAAYRTLNRLYPHDPRFAERLINFTRSFGQKNDDALREAARAANSQADFLRSSVEYRTRSGELDAELGDYESARAEWEKLIPLRSGDKEIYLETATVYWDYFQYEDALRTIEKLRDKFGDRALYAFETGAIFEARRQKSKALAEYVKALGAGDEQKDKAKKRLANLVARDSGERGAAENIRREIAAAFAAESARRRGDRANASLLALGYAEFLAEINQTGTSESVLNRAIAESRDDGFLETALDFYRTEENNSGVRIVLRRLAETAKNPRRKIRFQLQLAESFEADNARGAAKNVLQNLARSFPTNYGVITETADFYRRLGFENEAAAFLQNALPKSRGAYRARIAQKLVRHLINLNRLEAGEKILAELHRENKTDTEIFAQLARVYLRRNEPQKLRAAFAETISELKKSAADRRELDAQIAALREPMIDAFTRLGDYRAAVEQHIEIINRDAEAENIENAIRYVQRYGAADVLLDYYQKLSAEAFKNYRWNVVLARIYAARGDLENAVRNYQAAILNQPEMPELYLAVAEIETRRNNFDAALKNLDEVLTLTGDAPAHVKKKIEILQKAGRFSEIEAERAKLPAAPEKKVTADEFAEARRLSATEKEKSRALYREAFAKLLENPLYGEMKTADIAAYVGIAREDEPLDKIAARLWRLREKLIEIADEPQGQHAAAARQRRATLDGALTEAIGAAAKTLGTDEELAALHDDWQNRIAAVALSSDAHQTVSLVHDLSRRAGFGDLEEKILRKKLDESISAPDKQIHLRDLVNFYDERGAYQKAFDALEKYAAGDLPLRASAARLVNNREKELEALRAIYWRADDKIKTANDENVARLLEILYAENRAELKSLTARSSVFQLQLVNFLLGKGERELAHAAIENSGFSPAWKLARNAETSLALKEFAADSECYFCEALQLASIGETIKTAPDKTRFLVGDDWFRLARGYGEWLSEKNDREIPAAKFLPAMIENQPRNAGQQFALGEFYLRKGEFLKAAEHFRMAIEIENLALADHSKLAALGAAFYLADRKDSAEEIWARLFAEGDTGAAADIEKSLNLFEALSRYGLAPKAREKVAPALVRFLQKNNAEQSENFQELVRAVALSFTDEGEKSRYFQTVLNRCPSDASLAEMLLDEHLLEKTHTDFFYERITGADEFSINSNYEFAAVRQRLLAPDEAESVYEQENDSAAAESVADKPLERRRKYLETLLERGANARAKTLIEKIESKFKERAPRPVWLRLAKIRTELRDGKFDPAAIESFIGITVPESSPHIKPPSIERFNDVRRLLQEERRERDAARISEAFFARNLALENFEAVNFAGLARAFFAKGDAEKALRVVHLMVETGSPEKLETALAEIAALDEIKMRAADAAKVSKTDPPNFTTPAAALKLAAEIAFEAGKPAAAIEFRQKLSELDPTDAANKLELAKIFSANDRAGEAVALWREIVADKNTPRAARWRAREHLREIPDVGFDAFSQFYRGIFSPRETAAEFFINSLLADKDADTAARHELIKLYALSGKPFAALKLAQSDQAAKPDELLRILSAAAENISDYARAIEFEKACSDGGNSLRIAKLQRLADEKNQRVTDFTVDAGNTRKL